MLCVFYFMWVVFVTDGFKGATSQWTIIDRSCEFIANDVPSNELEEWKRESMSRDSKMQELPSVEGWSFAYERGCATRQRPVRYMYINYWWLSTWMNLCITTTFFRLFNCCHLCRSFFIICASAASVLLKHHLLLITGREVDVCYIEYW